MRNLLILTLISACAFALFFPTINLHFASDDFYVIKKLCVDEIFWTEGFFRPVGDLLLLLDFKIAGGFNASVFHTTNIVIHSINAYLIYVLASSLPSIQHGQKTLFSFIASFLFLTYPFHSESILWIVSRSSALGAMFGITTLIAYFRLQHHQYRFIIVGLFYALGLMCFENIIFIPAIIIIFDLVYFRIRDDFWYWVITFGIVIILHFLFRLAFSGALWGSYGANGLFSSSISRYLLTSLKAFGRLFLPPSDNATFTIFLFVAVLVLFFSISYKIFKKRDLDSGDRRFILSLTLALLISMIIPCMFGISTHTSEGDRLLYFPSVFYILLLSFFIIYISKSKTRVLIMTFLIAFYHIIFLLKIQDNWLTASRTILAFKNRIETENKNIILVANVPGEYEGAYIFRNGINDAPAIWGMPEKQITALNIMNKMDYLTLDSTIKAIQVEGQKIFIPPVNWIWVNGEVFSISNPTMFVMKKNETSVLFWENFTLKGLEWQ